MGAACAPSYANLFLGLWERTIFMTEPAPHIEKVLQWGRYIDDILFVWQGTAEELSTFMTYLNTNELNIKLTYKWGRSKMEFLDVLFDVDQDGYISTDVYRKKTSTNTLLHASSSHPHALVSNIPTGQFLRIRRICSTDEHFEKQANDLSLRFQERGYQERDITRGYARAKDTPRGNLLTQSKRKKGNDQRIPSENTGTCPRN
ncbi:uncharacterized protein LOC130369083 [Hyla sarda]|uniref:uncharacterized protein LOC130369083 n=1 Tax=Hyla sarda TaxID=327740 RepID=UPI0024C40BF1|nr:uncharacterized protein LOC130357954 isoform X1 [Hyla sarda]XP_056416747.1 uncharacterized protein LOC130357979 isoform X1 [Hyla sarda]XP_056429779.1 uncharacterized protein LOC130369083 [Hyla sarda]